MEEEFVKTLDAADAVLEQQQRVHRILKEAFYWQSMAKQHSPLPVDTSRYPNEMTAQQYVDDTLELVTEEDGVNPIQYFGLMAPSSLSKAQALFQDALKEMVILAKYQNSFQQLKTPE